MHCPFCDKDQTTVLESRCGVDGHSIRRRRECLDCNKRFTTYERIEGPILMVVKKDGRREMFDRQKMAGGIMIAFHKRPVPQEKIVTLVDMVERELLRKGVSEIPSSTIGKIVMRRLKKIDKVAWLRFASVYLAFETLQDFEKIIERT